MKIYMYSIEVRFGPTGLHPWSSARLQRDHQFHTKYDSWLPTNPPTKAKFGSFSNNFRVCPMAKKWLSLPGRSPTWTSLPKAPTFFATTTSFWTSRNNSTNSSPPPQQLSRQPPWQMASTFRMYGLSSTFYTQRSASWTLGKSLGSWAVIMKLGDRLFVLRQLSAEVFKKRQPHLPAESRRLSVVQWLLMCWRQNAVGQSSTDISTIWTCPASWFSWPAVYSLVIYPALLF